MTSPEGTDRRARRAWRIAGIGGASLGAAFAAVAALTGGGGRLGFAFFLLASSFACAVGTLYAVGTGALDSFRGERVGRSRVVAAVVLGIVSLLSLVMAVGLTSA